MFGEVAFGYLERRRPADLTGGRVAAQHSADLSAQATQVGRRAGDLENVPVGQLPARVCGAGVAAGHDQIAGAGVFPAGEPQVRAG
jgi:hypothetical protein